MSLACMESETSSVSTMSMPSTSFESRAWIDCGPISPTTIKATATTRMPTSAGAVHARSPERATFARSRVRESRMRGA